MQNEFAEVFQDRLPAAHRVGECVSRLPGIQPLQLSDWLLQDEAFAGQMALRDWLIAEQRDAVLQVSERAVVAVQDLLDTVLAALSKRADYVVGEERVTRPDSVIVAVDGDDPMASLGRLV